MLGVCERARLHRFGTQKCSVSGLFAAYFRKRFRATLRLTLEFFVCVRLYWPRAPTHKSLQVNSFMGRGFLRDSCLVEDLKKHSLEPKIWSPATKLCIVCTGYCFMLKVYPVQYWARNHRLSYLYVRRFLLLTPRSRGI